MKKKNKKTNHMENITHNFQQINKANSISNAWKNMLDHKDLSKKGLIWILGNGSYINFGMIIG